MTQTWKCYAVAAALLVTIPAAHASPCSQAITSVQSQVSSAVETDAISSGWKPESLYALRGYQPTPGTLAASEGYSGRRLEEALNSLERARAADHAMDLVGCNQEVDRARAELGQ